MPLAITDKNAATGGNDVSKHASGFRFQRSVLAHDCRIGVWPSPPRPRVARELAGGGGGHRAATRGIAAGHADLDHGVHARQDRRLDSTSTSASSRRTSRSRSSLGATSAWPSISAASAESSVVNDPKASTSTASTSAWSAASSTWSTSSAWRCCAARRHAVRAQHHGRRGQHRTRAYLKNSG